MSTDYRPAACYAPSNVELLESGQYSDAKIVVNGKTINVHKTILCPRSAWFRTAFNSSFIEGRTGVVVMSGSDNIDRLLEFLYSGTVTVTADEDIMEVAIELAVLGDFYLIDELRKYATELLGNYLREKLTAICEVRRTKAAQAKGAISRAEASNIASRLTFRFNKLESHGFTKRLCAAIRTAYATNTGIQAVLVDFVYASRLHTFRNARIQALNKKIPQFGSDILSALMTGVPRSSAFRDNAAFRQWQQPFFNPLHAIQIQDRKP